MLQILFAVVTAVPSGICANPPSGDLLDCSFYNECVEKAIPCGEHGYAIAYGGHYCNVFSKRQQQLSKKGNLWANSVRECLQRKLVPIVTGNGASNMTCPKLKAFAYKTHEVCYTLPGKTICELDPEDWIKILDIIKKELLDIQTYNTMIHVGLNCGKEYVKKLIKLGHY